jgi:Annexin
MSKNSLPNHQPKKKFFELRNVDLGKYLASELSGKLEYLMYNILQAAEAVYDPNYHTTTKMMVDARNLFNMGQGKWGTNEEGLFNILCSSPPEYLKQLNQVYADMYGKTLVQVLESELSGSLTQAALNTIGMKLKPYDEVAKLIKEACKGFGTDEMLFTCCLIRYQSIMNEVMKAHFDLFGKSIRDRIISETNGDYKKILMEIVETGEVS